MNSSTLYKLFSFIFGITTIVFIYLYLNKEKDVTSSVEPDSTKAKTLTADDVQAAGKWQELQALAAQFSRQLDSISKVRADSSQSVTPIDEAIGDVYIGSFRDGAGRNNTKAVMIPKSELAFFILYLDANDRDTIQASIGRYDKARLDAAVPPLRDGMLENNMHKNFRYNLIFGLPTSSRPEPTAQKYTEPFILGASRKYSDWHDIWP